MIYVLSVATFLLGIWIGKKMSVRQFRVRYENKKPVVVEDTPFTHAHWGEGSTVKTKKKEVEKPVYNGLRISRGDGPAELDAELRQMRKRD